MSRLYHALRIHRIDLLFVAALLLSYPLAAVLPPVWGSENGPIENAQVAVLLFGCGAAIVAWRHGRGLAPAMLALAAAPVWIILIGRELSWGAVLIHSARTGMPISPEALWYKPAVAPAICAALAWSLTIVWRHRLGHFLLQMAWKRHLALIPLLLAMTASYFSACAEGHAVCGIHQDGEHAVVWEEMLELIAYGAVVLAQHLVLQACRAYSAQETRPTVQQGDVVH